MRENNSSLRWAAGALLAISLIAFVVSQQDKIRDQAEEILQLENRLTTMETMFNTESAANQQLRAENEALQKENLLLRDSIGLLGKQVKSLEKKLRRHEATLAGIKAELAKKDRELRELKAKLQKLEGEVGRAASAERKNLRQEIEQVKEQTETLREMAVDETRREADTEEALIEREITLRRKEAIEAITTRTTVNYDAVECRKTRSSGPISKLKDDGSNWVYTTFKFNLENPDQKLLADEYFTLKIICQDTGEELPYLESNPAYANSSSETRGFTFQWRENPTEIVYINMQTKSGMNYEARIYFVSDEKEYLVQGSAKQIFQNGKTP